VSIPVLRSGLGALLVLLLLGQPQVFPAEETRSGGPPARSPLDWLAGERTLYEVLQYLYRWYWAEEDVRPLLAKEETLLWWREVPAARDEGDRSRFLELYLPELHTEVVLKKADYELPERGVRIRNEHFHVLEVHRRGPIDEEDWSSYRLHLGALMDYLLWKRSHREYPDATISTYMAEAVAKALANPSQDFGSRVSPGEFPVEVHVAPLSPVGNDLWVYWEEAEVVFKFESEADLSDPLAWETHRVHIQTYDLRHQVVVSLAEVPGSNAFLTRDRAGRILYNCVVLGQWRELNPPGALAPAP
jgi:hypothetical protein